MPYFGTKLEKQKLREYHIPEGYLQTMALNECLRNHPERQTRGILTMLKTKLRFEEESFRFCLTGLCKNIYYNVFGWEAEEYMELFDRFRLLVEKAMEEKNYRGDVFMVLEGDVKQMAILFSPGEAPQCTPEELAEEIGALGQKLYEQEIFHGDARYCNVTALSKELHGFSGIREGYLEARKLNDLSFFRMEPGVVTTEGVKTLRNGADYRVVIGACHRLQQALDEGNPAACRRELEALFLKTVKGACRWALLQDALSYCKHMLELRCTVRGLEGIGLEKLCDVKSYLRVEECVEALWPILERLCALVGDQGAYQDLMLRAIYYIKLHYAEDISLTDVAAYANVNPNYLSGAFQKELGFSLREFITGERVEAAKALLAAGERRVADVAEAVGIHDVKYFGRIFKKAVGITPGEYREKYEKSRGCPRS